MVSARPLFFWCFLVGFVVLSGCADYLRYGRSVREIIVRKGDTYYSIALSNRVSVRTLIDFNRAKPPYGLRIGDTVHIPATATHIVRKGDTLYSISRRYRINISLLARHNNIKPPYILALGTRLDLPNAIAKSPNAIAKLPNAIAKLPNAIAKLSARSKLQIARNNQRTRVSTGGAQNESKKTNPPRSTRSTSGSSPQGPERFIAPVPGKIISTYGPKKNGFHNDGINIAAPEGAPVQTVAHGTVVYVGNQLKGYGNLILIRHYQGWISAYAHLSDFKVRNGQKLKRGDIIAEVGRTGNVTTPQLHFELRKGTRAVNPQSFI